MRHLFLALFLLALPGCAQFDAAKGAAATEGAKVADEVMTTTEFMLCKGVTVGAWVRQYGASADKANAWRTLCATGNSQTPAK